MNINELKKIAEKNEYELTERLEQYEFVRRSEIFYHRITISKVRVNGLWIFIKVWCDDKDFNMIKAVVEFAETPVDEREKEKKFYLKHRWLISGGFYMYVKHHTKPYGEVYELVSWRCGEINGMQFTLKEIEKIKKEFNTDLKDFEIIEVEE